MVAVIPAVVRIALGLAVLLALVPRARVARGGNGALSGVIDLRYQRAFGDEVGVENAFTLGFRARALAGRRVAACFGLDARAGLGGGGAAYLAEAYPLGIGLRYDRTSQVALCAGVGLAGVSGGAVPFAWTFPAELHWEGTGAYRVIRPLVIARAVHVAGGRDGGTLFSAVDELHLSAGLRALVPAEPLPGLLAGDGVFIGLTYDEALGARIFGVAIGYGFAANHQAN